MNNDLIKKYDDWLNDIGPAALVLREYLIPAEGGDAVLFPATFAPSEEGSFKGGYNIDEFGAGRNICLIDSIGSQANRIEPLFMRDGYKDLVPQIVVTAGNHHVNLLEVGHRAGDAIIRCSELGPEMEQAFMARQKGDCVPLARIAPTSLVFGVWDSRGTQVKLPRLVSSTIRAYDVRKLTRSAQYIPALDYVGNGLLDEPMEKKEKDILSKRGFNDRPVTGTHGGVIADGGIRRDAALHLGALRLLKADNDIEKTLSLRRYIFGLALTALTYTPSGYLRQGCNLVLDPDQLRKFFKVDSNGKREDMILPHEHALEYAKLASKMFEVGKDRNVNFKKEFAKKDISGDEIAGKKKASKKTS